MSLEIYSYTIYIRSENEFSSVVFRLLEFDVCIKYSVSFFLLQHSAVAKSDQQIGIIMLLCKM